MRSLILLFILLKGTFLLGQNDPISNFGEEDATVNMDAFDFASGRMNEVKGLLKLTLDDGFRVGYEHKLGSAFSINSDYKFGFLVSQEFGDEDPEFTFVDNLNIGVRYYLEHKKRVQQGLQGNNLNGYYFELGFNFAEPSLDFLKTPYLRLGTQSRFLKHGFIDVGLDIQYNQGSNTLGINTGFDLGLAFSKKYKLDRLDENKCEIVKCFKEESSLLKIPINTALNMLFSSDRLAMNFVPKASFEHKISPVSLSLNHQVIFSYLYEDSKVESRVQQALNAEYRIALRWYVSKKRRIIKGKTANNLTGFYVSPILGIGIVARSDTNFAAEKAAGSYYSIGFKIGYQTRLLKNLFIDWGIGAMGREFIAINIYANPGLPIPPKDPFLLFRIGTVDFVKVGLAF